MADAGSLAAIRRDADAKANAIRALWQLGSAGARRQSYLYAVLDAARDTRIYPRLRQLAATELVVGLYQGRSATELAAVAPYLVCLGTTDRVFDWLWDQGWGESWGIFLWSIVSHETLRAHFRRLNMVQTEEKQRLLFRFYDPRVLRSFLPTCDAVQLREMFGPVAAYMTESAEGDAILSFRGSDRLVATTAVIAPAVIVPPVIAPPVIASGAKQSPASGGTSPSAAAVPR